MAERCISCRSDVGTRVQMTRQYRGQVYRRRVCRCCGAGHYTVEVAVDGGLPDAPANGLHGHFTASLAADGLIVEQDGE